MVTILVSAMEKRKAHYHLDEIKQAFSSPDKLRMSVTALMTMASLNFTKDDAIRVIQLLSMRDLYKSMTSNKDHRIWQDVYHCNYEGVTLYVKITIDEEGYFLISFKEK
jgi:motility quorum-sensing regulator/GCU-specific mRNA interferase toxin